MQAVILAAGLGSRLGDLTATIPKALVEVAGRPLVTYALEFVRAAGVDRVVVVRGHCGPDVEAVVRRQMPYVLVANNPDYRKGNALSLRAALPALLPRGYLVMNTDHIYRPQIAAIVASTARDATRVTAFCDFDRQLGADDMKVELRDGLVERMSKTLEHWDSGYVGMTYVPSECVAEHQAALAAVIAKEGESVNVEAALVELARIGRAPAIADVSGHGWLEVDEPHERTYAERVLVAERWWS